MYDLAIFAQRVKELCRQSYPYDDGRRANQTDLASAVGLSMTELNRRLNGGTKAQLTDRDVRAIVRTLAEWGAITSHAEAQNLLDLVCCTQFSAAEWNSPPLDTLTPLRPASAPPVPSPDEKTNLPLALTSFVGREREQAEIARLLDETRLLTLSGPGGVGKTRLALTVAATLAPRFADGVWLVELAGLSDPELVPQALASVLKVTEQPAKPLLETLTETLRGRETLLLLDNCEHLLLAVAQAAHQLLAYCPRLQVLTTSRERLRIQGETLYSVPPLGHPAAQAQPRLGRLARYPAIRLFVARAVKWQPHFRLTEGNAAEVRTICARLDGLSLAIELAAARMDVMSVADIQAGLADRFALLTEGDRLALPRQQTLYALIDWSYSLLTDAEQRRFSALAVFAGGWDFAAAAAVCADSTDPNVQSTIYNLQSLADKSLIVRGWSGDEGRFGMLESIREYGLAQLKATGREADSRERHAEYYRQLAEQAEPELRGAAQTIWLERLEQEHDNIRAALAWALPHKAETAARLAATMSRFWNVRGYLDEGRRWLTSALNNQAAISAGARAGLFDGAGRLAYSQGDYPASGSYYQQALALKRRLGDRVGTLSVLNGLGNVAYRHADYPAAQAYYEECLLISKGLDDQRLIANSLIDLANVAKGQGNLAAARQFDEQSLTLLRSLGDQRGLGRLLINLAIIIYAQGDAMTSRALHEEGLALLRELGDKYSIALALKYLGDITCMQGDYATARRLLDESLTIQKELGNKHEVASALLVLGSVACCEGDHQAARQIHQESLALSREVGSKLGIASALLDLGSVAALRACPAAAQRAARLLGAGHQTFDALKDVLFDSELATYDRALATCHATLSEEEFEQAWNEGVAMTMEQAIAYALEEDGSD